MTLGTLLVLTAASAFADPMALAFAAPAAVAEVTTEVILEIGTPQAETRPVPAGTVLLFEGQSGSAMERYAQIRKELRDVYRFEALTKKDSAMLKMAVGESRKTPSPMAGLDIGLRLLAVDDLIATYEVRMAEAGKEPLVTRVAVKRSDWAIVGGRDGAAAPYFYLLFRPLSAAEEKEEARWDGITRPKLISSVNPTYPEDARLAREQDTIVLELEVRPDGAVVVARVVEGQVASLIEAAKAAVSQWRYEPARDAKGKPLAVKYKVTLAFKLQ